MPGFLREHPGSLLLSLLLHGLMAAALVLMTRISFHRSEPDLQPLPIDATVIDSRVLHAAEQARADAAAARQATAARAAELVQQQRAQEQARAAAAAEQQQQRTAAAERAVAAERAAASERAAQTAQTARAAAAVRAAEVKRAADAAAEAKRAADAKRALEAKRAADARAKAETQADLRRQIAAEEHLHAVETGPLLDSYRASLANRIIHAWIKPPTARRGIDCRVEVTQLPGGEVTSVHVTQCNGDDAVRQSIENAVYRASPLPEPPDPALFQRDFIFEFKPDE